MYILQRGLVSRSCTIPVTVPTHVFKITGIHWTYIYGIVKCKRKSQIQDGGSLTRARDTAPPWSALAAVSWEDRVQTGGAGLSMPPWPGAELPRRRIHPCVGDRVTTASSVSFDRPVSSSLAFSGRHSAVVRFRWRRLKHGTAFRHMSHHVHLWRHSNVVSRLSCSRDRTFEPVIG